MGNGKHWIQTYTGKQFFYDDIDSNDIDIRDVAHALSNIPRFAGHMKKFYSVAEHSVNVARLCSTKGKKSDMWGLLHDASEAYISDIPKPMKWAVPEIVTYELKIQIAVRKAFDITFDDDIEDIVDWADLLMLITERYKGFDFIIPWGYYEDIEPANMELKFLSPNEAEREFLKIYSMLT